LGLQGLECLCHHRNIRAAKENQSDVRVCGTLLYITRINKYEIYAFEKKFVTFPLNTLFMFEVGVGICLCQSNFCFLPVDGSRVPVNFVALRKISYPQIAMRSNGLKTGKLTLLSRPKYMHCSRKN
jgi:hypothetical protein